MSEEKMSFEQAMVRLEEIVRSLERGDAPLDQLVELGGVRIFAVHGHVEGVSGGIGALVQKAKRFGAQVALFGHTHVAFTGYQDGITLLNPGSIARPRDGRASYGALDILPSGIMPLVIRRDTQ